MRLLKGVEVDILADGELALPDSALRRLDVVIVAIHHQFNLPARKQTARLLRALDRPNVHILAHPTGRLINERTGYTFDVARVLDALRQRGGFLELNAQPSRLDADDLLCRAAQERGVLISIGRDAHRGTDFACLEDGVRQARRGWLSAADVLNTRPLPAVLSLLQRAPQHADAH
jgi:DNA polymerase (family 10)